MKFLVSIGFFVILVAIWAPLSSGARVCVIDLRNCRTKTNVCGRFGRSNLCARFNNRCALQSANCAQATGYTEVNASFCRGIGVNQRGSCNGLSSSTGSNFISKLFNLGGGSTSNIHPIVIRT